MDIIIGNICSLLAMGTDAISSTQKSPKRMLWIQNISQMIYCAGAVVLKGYSGAVQNVVSIIRNLTAIRKIHSKVVQWSLVALGVVLGIGFNNLGLAGFLPIVGSFAYSVAIFQFQENEVVLKLAFLFSSVMYALFNLAIFNVVGFCTNLFVALTTVVYLIRKKRLRS